MSYRAEYGELLEAIAQEADAIAMKYFRADGMRVDALGGAKGPVDHVEIVDVLFADVVAGQPGEVEPVSQLPFHVGPARLPQSHLPA